MLPLVVLWQPPILDDAAEAWVAGDAVNLRATPAIDGAVVAELPLGTRVSITGRQGQHAIGDRPAPWYRVHTPAGDGFVWGGTLTAARLEADLDADGTPEVLTLSFRSDHHQILRIREGDQVAELDLGVDGDIGGNPDEMSLSLSKATETGVPLAKVFLPGREMCGSGTTTHWVSWADGKLREAASESTWADAPYWSTRDLTFDPAERTATLVHKNGGEDDESGEEIVEEKTTKLVYRDGVFQP